MFFIANANDRVCENSAAAEGVEAQQMNTLAKLAVPGPTVSFTCVKSSLGESVCIFDRAECEYLEQGSLQYSGEGGLRAACS